MSTLSKTLNQSKLSVKAQTFTALLATAAAVALPQVCHLIGWATGTGKALGVALLPMHLPILLVGLLAGPVAGTVAGFLSPLVSFALTGMPLLTNLPLMMAELAVYGLVTGLLKNAKFPTLGKVALAQLAGRLCYAGVLALAIYAFGNPELSMQAALASTTTGIWGTVIQLAALPLLVKAVQR